MAAQTSSTIGMSFGDRAAPLPPVTLADFSSLSEEMSHCLELARLACDSSAPVLIAGEYGTGRKPLAFAIHQSSSKRSHPCVILDCAGLGDNAVKMKLFGAGGASGGYHENLGLLAKVTGGTLIIDEADFLPGFVQKQLLGFLRQNSRVAASISGSLLKVGTRLITTSGGDKDRKSDANLLIEDLLYYLGEITIRIPPLRRRREDLPALTAVAIATANAVYGKNVGGLSSTAADFVRHYDFPGNVRELFRIINRATAGSHRDTLYLEDFGPQVCLTAEEPQLLPDAKFMPLMDVERRHIHQVLLRTGWKKQAAARILCVSQSFLQRKIYLYGLERDSEVEF
ncbi:MAG: sigma 54-interacting transcriptional regulator [Planctomycetes bacterium]|nr:sigma 54-interacting transcriptional regulator [Planctomycetota bacterium]